MHQARAEGGAAASGRRQVLVRHRGRSRVPRGTEEVIVQWVWDPELVWRELEDTAATEIAIVDYRPDFYVVA